MRKKILYGVIILNYNTPDDAKKAAENVIANATTDNFCVFIVDNKSMCDLSTLENFCAHHVVVHFLNDNKGYANGNNQGIQHMLEDYEPEFTVIMNPDVLLLTKGTIEGLISKYKASNMKLAGVSPAVWNPNLSDDYKTQITAFVAPKYWEMYILNGGLAKILFKKAFKRCTYMDKMPYKDDFIAEAVSGAFFIVNTKIFESVDFFDSRTFLYMEEHIIGAKLKKQGYSFLVSPDYVVEHEGGKSTKASVKRTSKKTIRYTLDSAKVYMRHYLKVSETKINVYSFCVWINFYLKVLYQTFFR